MATKARQTKTIKRLLRLLEFKTVEAAELELKAGTMAWSGEVERMCLLLCGAKLHKDAVLRFLKSKGETEQDAEKHATRSVIVWRFMQEGHFTLEEALDDGMVKLLTGIFGS